MRIKLEHYATALSITGAVLLSIGHASLVPWSLAFQIAGGVLWCIYAYKTRQQPLLLVNAAFVAVEVWGLFNWI